MPNNIISTEKQKGDINQKDVTLDSYYGRKTNIEKQIVLDSKSKGFVLGTSGKSGKIIDGKIFIY
ncbi:hypothetical protein [Candidatus Pseudoruminococcus sp.]|uniref:hypothetical protein n=1 Tax=Candidatus Pseudoruminococcus sp. TaxID=3101048 RepID=UPI00399BED4D